MRGQARCDMHGGKTPRPAAVARRTLAADRLRRSLDQVDVRDVADPLAEYRRVVAESIAFKDALAGHVASLEDRLRYSDDKGAEQLRAEVALYERALDRVGRFLAEWVRLGIDEKLAEAQVRVTELQAKVMLRGLEAYRDAAGVTDEAHEAGLDAMARVMRRAA